MITIVRTTKEWVHEHFKVEKEIDASHEIWKVMDGDELAMVVGVLVPSLIGWADIWIIPGKITSNVLRKRRELMQIALSHFPQISAHVQGAANERFAEFFGFHPKRMVEIAGKRLLRLELWPQDFQ